MTITNSDQLQAVGEKIDWEKMEGLLPAVVQHHETHRVLMLGYMSRESLEATFTHRKVTFYSRSRQALWQKGETSGHTLNFVSLELDCDNDAFLIQADPIGPTCHLMTESCFDRDPDGNADKAAASDQSLEFLSVLQSVIASRRDAPEDSSYTASLFNAGMQRMAQKVGEEGVEVALAAVAADSEEAEQELLGESADLVYHLMVLLAAKGLQLGDVVKVLKGRHGQ